MGHISQEDEIKQVLFEHELVNEGVSRYRESIKGKALDQTQPGSQLMDLVLPGFIETIKQATQDGLGMVVEATGGRTPAWALTISILSPEELAVLTVKTVLGTLTNPTLDKHFAAFAMSLGDSVRDQVDFNRWLLASNLQAEEDQMPSVADQLIKRAGGKVDRRYRARWKKRCENYLTSDWPKADKVSLGTKLIGLLSDTHPDVFEVVLVKEGARQRRCFRLVPEMWDQIATVNDALALSRPFLIPMICEPKDWTQDPETGALDGGYYSLKQPLFTSGIDKHTSEDSGAVSEEFLAAINTVQKTEWSINTRVYNFINELMVSGIETSILPTLPSEGSPLMLNDDEWNNLTKDERSVVMTERRDFYEEQASMRGKFSALHRKMAIATTMLEHDKFYFPHFADFRTRLYPMPQELNPQGDHICKGLLQFHKGVELGPHGLTWLEVHVANLAGQDKATFDDRLLWVQFNRERLIALAHDPMANLSMLENEGADEPMAFLSAVFDLVASWESSNPVTHVSHTCVAMDGVCNGMQILSLLSKDASCAQKTNCSSDAQRYDLYTEVADEVRRLIQADDGHELSAPWLDALQDRGFARKAVKRAVMTSPYGVTPRGIKDQLVNDKITAKVEGQNGPLAEYFKNAILDSMKVVATKPFEVMAYLQECAGILAAENIAMQWTTPMGVRVTQSYQNTKRTRITTVLGDVSLLSPDRSKGLNVRKNFQSAAPNVVHSLDASMLQLTGLALEANGVTDTGMIHDSYGTHAAHVQTLHAVLRDCALEMFSDDWLAGFHEDVLSQAPPGVEIPKPPTQGSYDINEITEAIYFFS